MPRYAMFFCFILNFALARANALPSVHTAQHSTEWLESELKNCKPKVCALLQQLAELSPKTAQSEPILRLYLKTMGLLLEERGKDFGTSAEKRAELLEAQRNLVRTIRSLRMPEAEALEQTVAKELAARLAPDPDSKTFPEKSGR